MRLSAHLAAIEAAMGEPWDAAAFEACGPVFARLVEEPDCLHLAMNEALEAVLTRPGHSPREVSVQSRADGRRIATQLPLAVRGSFSVALCVQEGASSHAFSAPGNLHVALLSGEAVAYDLYELPDDHDNEVFRPCRLKPLGARELRPGGRTYIDARRQVPVFPDQPAVYLKLESRWLLPFEWAFDLQTLEAWQVASTSLEDTQLVYAAQALAALGDADGLDALARLLRHRRHQVRWAALRAFARLGGERVRPHLESALEDTHPHVRAAARAALERHVVGAAAMRGRT